LKDIRKEVVVYEEEKLSVEKEEKK